MSTVSLEDKKYFFIKKLFTTVFATDKMDIVDI